MGGPGSGRTGWRPLAENMLRLDVRQLQRKGWLCPGMAFTLHWTRGGNPAGSISLSTSHDFIRLMYSSGSGENREAMDYEVTLDRTPCHYGGTRAWFLCPRCGRRVAMLYGGKRFLCRHCHDLGYAVENEDAMSRLLRRSNKLRERVKAKVGTAYPVMFKPKGMHQRTFDRIRWEIQELEAGFWLAAAEKFNLTV